LIVTWTSVLRKVDTQRLRAQPFKKRDSMLLRFDLDMKMCPESRHQPWVRWEAGRDLVFVESMTLTHTLLASMHHLPGRMKKTFFRTWLCRR
jgi:hypothetical protein